MGQVIVTLGEILTVTLRNAPPGGASVEGATTAGAVVGAGVF
jgi:hypothetical protein